MVCMGTTKILWALVDSPFDFRTLLLGKVTWLDAPWDSFVDSRAKQCFSEMCLANV